VFVSLYLVGVVLIASFAVDRGNELLGDDRLDRRGELHPNLLLLMRWEDVDDPVDGLRRVLRVERGEHQVSGFRRS
jgi:hypothetical protein